MTTPQLTDDELQDLAHSAYEEAMSLGLSVDTFLRYFKGIRNRLATQAQGQDAAPAEFVKFICVDCTGCEKCRPAARAKE